MDAVKGARAPAVPEGEWFRYSKSLSWKRELKMSGNS